MTNSNKKKTDRVGFILKPSTIAAAAAIAASLVTPLRAQTTSWIGTIGLHSIQKGIEAEISKGILTKGIIGEDTSSNSKGDLYYAIFWNQNGSLSLNNGNIADKQDKTVTLTGNLNLKYNLEEDKSTVATALNFFEPEWMDEGNNYGLHKFHFDGSVNITIENASIEVSNMDADGKDNPGLLLTNKKKIVTFDNRANLLVGYQAILDSENPGDTNSLLVLSGIYTAFGAAEKFTGTNVGQKFGLSGNGPATFTDEDLEKLLATPGGQMGTTAFNGGLNLVMVNSQTEANAQLTAPNRAAYGIFINEGGLVDIKGGNSNIILIGSEGSTQLAAVNLSARAGILDILKQGRFKFSAENGKNRLWSFSTNILHNAQLSPTGQTAADAAKHVMHLRDAIQSFHGAAVDVSDSYSGWLDIRGAVVAGVKNESVSLWNGNSSQGNMRNVVNHADVEITLSNPNSRFFGNLYERHRLGAEEAASFSSNFNLNGMSTFQSWRDYMTAKEHSSLGGRVDLTLANGAAWYPIICENHDNGVLTDSIQTGWKGWDYSTVTSLADANTENDGTMTGFNAAPNFSDQYNLYWTDKDGAKHIHNAVANKGSALNDEDLIKSTQGTETNANTNSNNQEIVTSGIPYVDRTGAKLNEATVDNGAFHLALDNGVVDTRFMRLDFNKLVYVQEADDLDAITLAAVNDENGKGIRRLRIQELDGTGGTFSIFAINKANHDLIIIDESASGSVEKPVVNNLSIWNDIEDQTLGIDDKDPTTFVHVARAGRDVRFSEHFLKKTKGSAWATLYTVKKDDGNKWTNAQNAALLDSGSAAQTDAAAPDGIILSHESQDNWFITDWKRTGNPEYEETAR